MNDYRSNLIKFIYDYYFDRRLRSWKSPKTLRRSIKNPAASRTSWASSTTGRWNSVGQMAASSRGSFIHSTSFRIGMGMAESSLSLARIIWETLLRPRSERLAILIISVVEERTRSSRNVLDRPSSSPSGRLQIVSVNVCKFF